MNSQSLVYLEKMRLASETYILEHRHSFTKKKDLRSQFYW
jgi:hypothetical protein